MVRPAQAAVAALSLAASDAFGMNTAVNAVAPIGAAAHANGLGYAALIVTCLFGATN